MDLEAMPSISKPEIAILGASNVGKSSLINMLTGNSSLAKVSKQPGKTRCINHFLINNKFYLVDCPGYGYAKVSKQQRLAWHQLTQAYLTRRPTLALVLLLVDSVQPVNKLDIDAALWLHEQRVPYTLVWTKVDVQPPAVSSHPATSNTAQTAQASASAADLPEPQPEADAHQADNPSPAILACQHSIHTFLHAIRHITGQGHIPAPDHYQLIDLERAVAPYGCNT